MRPRRLAFGTMHTKKGNLPFWGVVVTIIVLLWALISLGNDNARLRTDYKSAVEESNQRYGKLESEFKDLKSDNVKLNKSVKTLKGKLQQEIKSTSPAPRIIYSTRNCEKYRDQFNKYNWNVDVALAVCSAESGGNPNAANWNDNHGVCRGSFGLMQISCHSGQVFNVAENVKIAYLKYQAKNWQPWTVCTIGKVACWQ